ncbi:hypothetical protein [Aliterella atlantica]|uniref:Uncharacterized protein n=1 Tax=Aliterella atlantica CENA595 TaxID=1618023 RepID=A0A0D8ZR13_9CYAN|nr:hypothetical protein [Aliterella atlantica]KJH71228.1 hypothetical protein UH38_13115 [Aliterella atlantica CENA595]
MSRFTWRRFREVLGRVHNVHVKRAIREANKGVDDARLLVNNKRNLILENCLIDKDDTAQIILLKELLFWIDLGHLNKNNLGSVSLPESWTAKRTTNIPQLVISYRNPRSKRTDPNYQLTIPHYKGTRKPTAVPYTKGNTTGTLILKDNSKFVVNAVSETEVEKLVNHYKKYISTKFLTNDLRMTERKGKRIKVVKYTPIRADYYPKGQDVPYPEWRHRY